MQTELIKIEKEAATVDKQAQEIMIRNQENYDIAQNFAQRVKAFQKKVKDFFAPMKKKAYDAYKEIVTQESKTLELPAQAEAIIKDKMMSFLKEQERVRQEQEAKLAREAEKKRQEALAKAEAAREAGKEAQAEKYEEKAAQVVAPILAPTVDKGSASMRKYWSAEIINLMDLVQAVAEDKISAMAIIPNMPFLNKQAEQLKDTFNYPGVKAIARDGLTISSRR